MTHIELKNYSTSDLKGVMKTSAIFNTLLPRNANVERLFGIISLMLSPKRLNLIDYQSGLIIS